MSSLSKDDRVSYENSLKYYCDLHNVIDTAEEKGFAEAEQKELRKKLLRLLKIF